MKVIKNGNYVMMYDGNAEVLEKIPNDFYNVRFNPMQGFVLEKTSVAEVTEKIYGSTKNKINKVISRYSVSDRNFGTILSGTKGMGKSIFARLLALEVVKTMPVIMVNQDVDGLSKFIHSIKQEAMILFDEFEKNFAYKSETSNGEYDPQEKLLTMFDGVEEGSKKLFVVIANDTYRLNDFLLGRPARFYYHFKFTKPESDDIDEYLEDKLTNKTEFEQVKNFIYKSGMNYDSMRALISEINFGSDLIEAIKDMNIEMPEEQKSYFVTLDTEDGSKEARIEIDQFSKSDEYKYEYIGCSKSKYLKFRAKDFKYSKDLSELTILKYEFTDASRKTIASIDKPLVLKESRFDFSIYKEL